MENALSNFEVVKLYIDSQKKALAANVDKVYPNLSMVRVVGKYFDNRKGKLLDYGCGFGANLIHLVKVGYHVTGADTSPHSKTAIQNKIKLINDISDRVELITINKEQQKLPFKDASFDYIVCASLLSLLSRKEIIINLLREFHRIIKNHGKLFLDINGINSEFAIYAKKLGKELYEYRGRDQKLDPIEVVCLESTGSFKRFVEKVFLVDEVGVTTHRFFDFAEEEYIVCARKSD